MNVGVASNYFSGVSIFNRFFTSLGRTIDRIGYLRAAAELRRLGYIEEANRCLAAAKRL